MFIAVPSPCLHCLHCFSHVRDNIFILMNIFYFSIYSRVFGWRRWRLGDKCPLATINTAFFMSPIFYFLSSRVDTNLLKRQFHLIHFVHFLKSFNFCIWIYIQVYAPLFYIPKASILIQPTFISLK